MLSSVVLDSMGSSYPSIEVGDYVRVKIDRISNSGNAIALSPRGYIQIIDGEEGEEVVVKIKKKEGNLIGEKIYAVGERPDFLGDSLISLEGYYERLEKADKKRRKKAGKNRSNSSKPKPPEHGIKDETADTISKERIDDDTDKKTKKERERENLNRLLNGEYN